MSNWKLAHEIEVGEEVVGPENVIYRVAAVNDLGDKIEFGLLGDDDVELTFTPDAFEEVEVA